jgi:1-acyl-sn-glycerol-3-phosphate acyltransferase
MRARSETGDQAREEAAEPQAEPRWYRPDTVADKAVSLALWGVGALWIAPVMGSLMALQMVLPSDRLEWLNRLYCWGQVKATGSKWRAVIHPSVDPNRVYMFCQNHVNIFDHCTMYRSTPHFKQGLELESHFRVPVYGWFMKQRGTIPVRSGKEGQTPEIMTYMREELARGHSILAFPEGTRSRDGRVAPFRRGVFYIARDLGIPIVPVAITGMQHVMRKGSLVIRPGHEVTVYCEEPIETAGIPDEDIGDLAARVRAPIAARVDAWLDEQARALEGE